MGYAELKAHALATTAPYGTICTAALTVRPENQGGLTCFNHAIHIQLASTGKMFHLWILISSLSYGLLVGGAITILKNMSSSMGRIIPYIMENKWK